MPTKRYYSIYIFLICTFVQSNLLFANALNPNLLSGKQFGNSDSISCDNINIDSVLDFGKRFLNKPYRYKVDDKTYFDCSGFTSYVYGKFGVKLIHSSAAQSKQFPKIKRSELKEGDLVYFSGRRRNKQVGHVGIVIKTGDNGTFDFIHSSNQYGVVITNSNDPYFSSRYITANRVSGPANLTNVDLVNATLENKKTDDENDDYRPIVTRKVVPAKYHKVRPGETLISIAKKYGVTVSQLKKNNHLKTDLLGVNKKIKIKDKEIIQLKSESTLLASSRNVKSGQAKQNISSQTIFNKNEDKVNQNNPTEKNTPIGAKLIQAEQITESKPESVRQVSQDFLHNAVKTIRHKVHRKENVNTLARDFKVSAEDIMSVNNLTSVNLTPGQEIVILIPIGSNVKPISQRTKDSIGQVLSRTAQPEKTSQSQNEGKPNQTVVVAQETNNEAVPLTSISKYHKVLKGETLFSLAKKFNITVDDLKMANSIRKNEIKIGQKLKIPEVSTSPEKTTKATKSDLSHKTKTIRHKVKSGESLYAIARKYKCSFGDIQKWNPDKTTLHKGDCIIIRR